MLQNAIEYINEAPQEMPVAFGVFAERAGSDIESRGAVVGDGVRLSGNIQHRTTDIQHAMNFRIGDRW